MNGKDRSGGRKKGGRTVPSFNPVAKLDPGQVKDARKATAAAAAKKRNDLDVASDRMLQHIRQEQQAELAKRDGAYGRQQMDKAGRAAAKKRGAKKASPPPKKKK